MKEQSNNLHEVEKQLTLTETELKFAEQAKLELNQKVVWNFVKFKSTL